VIDRSGVILRPAAEHPTSPCSIPAIGTKRIPGADGNTRCDSFFVIMGYFRSMKFCKGGKVGFGQRPTQRTNEEAPLPATGVNFTAWSATASGCLQQPSMPMRLDMAPVMPQAFWPFTVTLFLQNTKPGACGFSKRYA
jgi:hypothetical protein